MTRSSLKTGSLSLLRWINSTQFAVFPKNEKRDPIHSLDLYYTGRLHRKHYIYVNPWGHVNEKDHGRIETILLVRYVGNRKVKIIAKAWNLSDSYSGVKSRHSRKERTPQELLEIKKGQMKDCEGIEYGGKKLADIFKYAEENDKQGILVSYEVGGFRRAKDDKRLYVDFSKKDEKGNPACHSLKGYYPSYDGKEIISKDKEMKKNVYEELKEKNQRQRSLGRGR